MTEMKQQSVMLANWLLELSAMNYSRNTAGEALAFADELAIKVSGKHVWHPEFRMPI